MRKKQKLDELLVERGLVENLDLAKKFIISGNVLVNGEVHDKASEELLSDVPIEVKQISSHVSRGGVKLKAALDTFHISVQDVIAADVGASTGGFTDCLLQSGARKVYAIDVGTGQLDWSLRQNPRVIVLEQTNARYLETLPEKVHFVCIDVSFISVKLILPNVVKWLVPEGKVVILIKPNFEAHPKYVQKGGVVRDEKVRKQVVADVISFAVNVGLSKQGIIESPIKGPSGNIESLAYFIYHDKSIFSS